MKTVKLLTGILAFTTFAVRLKAQHSLPVLRANTVSIDVREGKNFYKGYWSASPSVKKDVYYAHRFTLSNNITFISDVDSVSFHLQPGKTYPFIILLNGRDSCYTEISTIRQTYHKQPGQAVNTDSIPFTIGQDGRIYIDGTVNHSAPLRFFFDNGADNTIVFPSAFKKGLQLVLDDSVQNNATGGTTMRGTSNSAIVQLGLMQWDN
ncbi:MAG TPA: hypothetical protein VHB48_05610, partial [Chitinophagaceae bacterium]|nr:hypothetical protein [Chitinophagaceae bacterium]